MIEKLKMESPDLSQEHIKEIQKLFPDVVTEEQVDGNTKLGIDFEKLKQELSSSLIDDGKERYQMTWPGKMEAIRLSNTPTTATLRPLPEKSVDFDKTQNVYIEGDNLEVLKIIRETYLNKIKMIYIDPPYNTGNGFVYNDKFKQSQEEYQQSTDEYDELGNRMVKNPESSGRYHTDWLNMIYPRIKLARDFLKDDGIIFISIDDNEVDNLKKVCNELFGDHNFIAQMVIEGTPKNDPLIISTAHEYCLVYVKNYAVASTKEWGFHNPFFDDIQSIFNLNKPDYLKINQKLKEYFKEKGLDKENIANYKYSDAKGVFRIGPIDDPQRGGPKDNRYNPITGEKLKTPNSGWRCSIDTWNEWVKNDEILFPADNTKLVSRKVYIKQGQLDLLRGYYKIQTRKDTDYLKSLFNSKVFSFPKPVELIKKFIDSSIKNDDIVMDFFAGSSTTAQAVSELNAERLSRNEIKQIRYILVQLPEDLYKNLKNAQGNREKDTCQNAINYCLANHLSPTLTSIGETRIKLSNENIVRRYPLTSTYLDVGFRVFKLDSSNMQNDFYSSKEMTKSLIETTIDNVKPDRTDMDLLIQVMLNLGLLLSSKIEKKIIGNKTVYLVNGNDLVACFDAGLTNDEIKQIAQLQPVYAAFRDSCFSSDSVGINNEQIFKTISPSTSIKVL